MLITQAWLELVMNCSQDKNVPSGTGRFLFGCLLLPYSRFLLHRAGEWSSPQLQRDCFLPQLSNMFQEHMALVVMKHMKLHLKWWYPLCKNNHQDTAVTRLQAPHYRIQILLGI
jgi:hypothetical protein